MKDPRINGCANAKNRWRAMRRLHTLGKKARGLQEQEWLLKARAPPFLPPFFPPFLRFPVRRWVSMNDGEAQLAGI